MDNKPQKAKSNLIICFPSVFDKSLIEGFDIDWVYINTIDFLFIKRPYTSEEKHEVDLSLRIGYDGLTKIHGCEPMKTESNPNFKKDLFEYLNNIIFNLQVEYIFLGYNETSIEFINKHNLPYYIVMPNKDDKYAFIGKLFCENDEVNAKGLRASWDITYGKFKELHQHSINKLLYLQTDETIKEWFYKEFIYPEGIRAYHEAKKMLNIEEV